MCARGSCPYGDARRGVRQCVHPTPLRIVYFIPSSPLKKSTNMALFCVVWGGGGERTGEDLKGPGFVRFL